MKYTFFCCWKLEILEHHIMVPFQEYWLGLVQSRKCNLSIRQNRRILLSKEALRREFLYMRFSSSTCARENLKSTHYGNHSRIFSNDKRYKKCIVFKKNFYQEGVEWKNTHECSSGGLYDPSLEYHLRWASMPRFGNLKKQRCDFSKATQSFQRFEAFPKSFYFR